MAKKRTFKQSNIATPTDDAAGSYPPTAPQQAWENITTDGILWYNVGVYGQMGYAVPNPSNDIGTLNPNMIDFTNGIGRGLFYIMHHEDVDLSTPPTVETLYRIHQLVVYMRRLVAARIQPDGELPFNPEHVSPAGEVFLVWPVPFHKVRNMTLKRWARYALYLLAELFQNSENRRLMNVYSKVGERIGGYLGRKIYFEMATEFFGKSPDDAKKPEFLLTDEDFAAYNPTALRPDWEANDPVPAIDNVFTEDRMAYLSAGIPLHELPPLQPYPTNVVGLYEQMRAKRAGTTNPDTGASMADGSRIAPPPPFPNNTNFVS